MIKSEVSAKVFPVTSTFANFVLILLIVCNFGNRCGFCLSFTILFCSDNLLNSHFSGSPLEY